MWYSAIIVFIYDREKGLESLCEEQVIVVDADDEEDVLAQLNTIAVAQESTYLSASGHVVHYKFLKIMQIQLIEHDTLLSGTCVSWRHLKLREVESMSKKFGDE